MHAKLVKLVTCIAVRERQWRAPRLHGDHERPTPASGRQQPEGLERPERLPDDRAADPELLGERDLARQLLANSDRARLNQREELRFDRLGSLRELYLLEHEPVMLLDSHSCRTAWVESIPGATRF